MFDALAAENTVGMKLQAFRMEGFCLQIVYSPKIENMANFPSLPDEKSKNMLNFSNFHHSKIEKTQKK